jgi:adenylate kinase family enzyme
MMFSTTSFPLPGQRIAVIGVTGSGKTTLATRLANMLGIPHVELDGLNWQPGWQPTEPEVFRQRVERALDCQAWVVDGNYSEVRDIVWRRADTLIWLDYPLELSFLRLTLRSFQRLFKRTILWNGNRESFKNLFLSKDSLFLYIFKSYRKHQRHYPQFLKTKEFAHLRLIRIRNPNQLADWLTQVRMLG